MIRRTDAELVAELRAAPLPDSPSADRVLARAFPEPDAAPVRRAERRRVAVVLAGVVCALVLAVALPARATSAAWERGLVQRGLQWSAAILEGFDGGKR